MNRMALSFSLCLSAAIVLGAGRASAQDSIPALERRVTLQVQEATLSEALKLVGSATGVSFTYSPSRFDSGRKVSMDLAGVTVREAVARLTGTAPEALQAEGNRVLIAARRNSAPSDTITEEMESVRITARRSGKERSEHAARIPLRNLENPQAYVVVPKELTQEQMATDYKSAFKNVPGAGAPNQSINGRTQFISRGFSTSNYIRNGMVSWVYSDVDPVNIERIEAIRGPSAVLFGGLAVSYGGLFNRVTKRPLEEFRGEISFSGGQWNLARATADVNLPLNGEKTALLRVNAASHEEGSFQDAGYSKAHVLAPSFSYRANDRLSFFLDAEWYAREAGGATNGISPYGITSASSMDEVGIDPRRSFSDNSLKGQFPTLNVNGQADFRFLPDWTSRTQYALSRFTNDQNSIQLLTTVSDEMARRRYMESRWTRYSHQVQQNFLGDFQIGPVRNRLLIGLDFYARYETTAERMGWLDPVNFIHPGPEYISTNIFTASKQAEAFSPWVGSSEGYTYSGYVSNVINPVEALSIHLGLRLDRFDNRGWVDYSNVMLYDGYEQDALSPKVGIVYEVLKNRVSLFGNFQNGFRNVDGRDFSGEAFTPEHADQWEGGVKASALAGRLTGTASVYHITVDDMVRTDPGNSDFSKQDGRQTSKGVDLELAANPVPGLNFVAGYAWNDSRLEKADPEYDGMRPEYSGAENAANLWAGYRLVEGRARGLGIGAGMNYMGEQLMINTVDRRFTVPEYLTVDATVFYDRADYRLGLKVDNLTDELYWNAWGSPQPPRRFIGNVTYRF